MRIMCFNFKHFFLQSSSPPQGKVRKKRLIASWRKQKFLIWRIVFEQAYSQQTDNKEQTGKLENLFSIQNLQISFIGFVIVPVMCISITVTLITFQSPKKYLLLKKGSKTI